MKNRRQSAIIQAGNREIRDIERPSLKISDYFAQNVFTLDKMRMFLSDETYKIVSKTIEKGHKIDRSVAQQVANAMKTWAISKGATHYTHWFQPLTGLTAEKHDTFFSPTSQGKGIEKFDGDTLIQGEPDGSSFPSGGLRTTHEARGYTAWDPSSPAFIVEIGKSGRTLCIPTIFISYGGASMDFKAPLLKSQEFLEKAALPVVNLFDRNATRVVPTLGWEQEFFLIDDALYNARPDLVISGRTVLGHGPSKGQQLDDHYFGTIPERVYAFMTELEIESLKLGIPLKTRHNEVAPGQYEFAPVFDEVNRAVDQNQLLMDLMKRVAKRHKMEVLLHEKPFAGLNGSGKHNNWSLKTDTGTNLLSPGKTPRKNIQFLTFFVNTIKAVNDYSDLLRASIASAGNDHRLGANEAPPAIISVFIGDALTKVLKEIMSRVSINSLDDYDKMDLKLDIHEMIPDLLLDNTDRNRTSPFAFTGNKFEFRAVGSSANCSFPMTVLNTIVGETLTKFGEEVKKFQDKGDKKDTAIFKVLKKYIKDCQPILFEGDNYSAEWAKEAKKRGLSNVRSSAYALDFLHSKEAKKIFSKHEIFTENELEARHEVSLENYGLKIQIEARLIGQIASAQVIPAVVSYLNDLTENVLKLNEIGVAKKNYVAQMKLIEYINEKMGSVNDNVVAMINCRKKLNKITDASKKSKAYSDQIIPFMEKIRRDIDKLELVIADDYWPLPKYSELLFIK